MEELPGIGAERPPWSRMKQPWPHSKRLRHFTGAPRHNWWFASGFRATELATQDGHGASRGLARVPSFLWHSGREVR